MRRTKRSFFREGLLSFVVVALALTNVSVAQFDNFRLMLFWPVFILAIVVNNSLGGQPTLRRSAGAFLFVAVLMTASWAINSSVIVPTTVALSIGWIVYWYWLTVGSGACLASDVERSLSWVAYIYLVALGASAVLSTFGWSESPFPELLGWVYDLRSGQLRFYGPTSEPSYAALILGVTALGILRVRLGLGLPARSLSSDLVFASILMSLLFLNSVYGIVVALLLLLAFASRAIKRSDTIIIFILALVPVAPFLLDLLFNDSRLGRAFALLSQGDISALQVIDNSAYMRLGPTVEWFRSLGPEQLQFWLGHGAGASEKYFGSIYGYLAGEGNYLMNLGFFPAFLYDYGVLASVAILLYLFSISRGPLSSYTRLLFFISLFNCNFNTHMFWYIFTIVFLTSSQVIGVQRQLIRKPFPANIQWPRIEAAP